MDAWEAGSRGVVWWNRRGQVEGEPQWFGLVGLKRMLGGKYRTFSTFRNPHAAKLQAPIVGGPIGRTKPRIGVAGKLDLGIACLSLRIRIRMSHSFRTLSHGAPPVACRPVLLFGQVGFASGVQQGFVCARSYR